MTLKERIEGFARLGDFISRHQNGHYDGSETRFHEGLNQIIPLAGTWNNWFIPKYVNDAIAGIGFWLDRKSLSDFCVSIKETNPKIVALICAGNIPMVCFHDLMCVLLTGHRALIKMSSDDNVLLPFFLKLLCHYEPRFESQIFFAEGKLGTFDAIIATGSDNTASHLHYYFGKYPHIIRKNRSSLAILKGNETNEELKALGSDIFQYFGLGCRNVNKLMVPAAYKFSPFFEAIVDFGDVVNNKKYGNNYDYHRALFLLEQIPFLDNNFLMIRENTALHSPVGVLHYEFYSDAAHVKTYLRENESQIQCVVGRDFIPFGYSQKPVISDFADNVNTLNFLVNL